MEKRYVIGIDIGTTTIKAVFVDAKQNRIATTQIEEVFPVAAEKKEYIEYDAQVWKDSVKKILARGFAEGIQPQEVAGICLLDFTVMAFLVDAQGNPLHNPVHYNDMRHLCVLGELEKKVGELCVARNGNYISMYNGLGKQYWWKKFRPDIYDRAAYFTTASAWMNYLLTGVRMMNRPTAGFYGQYNALTREWDEEIIRRIGMDPQKFPPLMDAWEQVGAVTKEAAEEWGLAEGTLVFGGMDDASPVALTCGTIHNGDCYISGGSAANVVIISDKMLSHPTAMNYPHCIPGLNMTATVLSSTGLSYKWVRNALGSCEKALAQVTGEDAYDILNREATQAPVGSHGLIFLPYLDGDYTPNNDPNARGCYVGLNTTTNKADMVRAVLEGVGFSFLSSLEMIRALGGAPQKLVISGGIVKSSLWMQIVADITGMSVSIPNEEEGAPLGSALVAGIGCGLFRDYEDAVDRIVEIERDKYVPNPEAHERYLALFQVYNGLYAKLKESFAAQAEYREKYC